MLGLYARMALGGLTWLRVKRDVRLMQPESRRLNEVKTSKASFSEAKTVAELLGKQFHHPQITQRQPENEFSVFQAALCFV